MLWCCDGYAELLAAPVGALTACKVVANSRPPAYASADEASAMAIRGSSLSITAWSAALPGAAACSLVSATIGMRASCELRCTEFVEGNPGGGVGALACKGAAFVAESLELECPLSSKDSWAKMAVDVALGSP